MPEDIKKLVGSRIRFFRKARGYTLAQFSEVVHKSKSSISKYEQGEVSIDLDTLSDIAGALQVPLQQLVASERAQKPSQPVNSKTAYLIQTGVLYVYLWDGRTKEHLRRHMLVLAEDFSTLYADVTDYQNPNQCRYFYQGEIQRFDASVRAFLVNPVNERDLVLINFADPLNYQSVFTGFFANFSVGQFQPFATKCVFSSNILPEDEELKQMVRMTRQELQDFKRLNLFRVMAPNFFI